MKLQGPDDVPPSEGEQTPFATLLQGFGQRRNGDSHTYHIVIGRVPVFDDTEHIHREELEVHLHILVFLALGHLGKAIKVGKGLIDHIEHLLTILLRTKHLTTLQIGHMEVVALHRHLCHTLVLLGHSVLRHV